MSEKYSILDKYQQTDSSTIEAAYPILTNENFKLSDKNELVCKNLKIVASFLSNRTGSEVPDLFYKIIQKLTPEIEHTEKIFEKNVQKFDDSKIVTQNLNKQNSELKNTKKQLEDEKKKKKILLEQTKKDYKQSIEQNGTLERELRCYESYIPKSICRSCHESHNSFQCLNCYNDREKLTSKYWRCNKCGRVSPVNIKTCKFCSESNLNNIDENNKKNISKHICKKCGDNYDAICSSCHVALHTKCLKKTKKCPYCSQNFELIQIRLE